MQDDEDRDLTPAQKARERGQYDDEPIVLRMCAGLCIRWGTNADACILPYDHRGSCQDAQGNTTLSITRQLLGR